MNLFPPPFLIALILSGRGFLRGREFISSSFFDSLNIVREGFLNAYELIRERELVPSPLLYMATSALHDIAAVAENAGTISKILKDDIFMGLVKGQIVPAVVTAGDKMIDKASLGLNLLFALAIVLVIVALVIIYISYYKPEYLIGSMLFFGIAIFGISTGLVSATYIFWDLVGDAKKVIIDLKAMK